MKPTCAVGSSAGGVRLSTDALYSFFRQWRRLRRFLIALLELRVSFAIQ